MRHPHSQYLSNKTPICILVLMPPGFTYKHNASTNLAFIHTFDSRTKFRAIVEKAHQNTLPTHVYSHV